MPAKGRVLGLPATARLLALHQLGRVDQRLKGEEALPQIRPHRGFIVRRFAVLKPLAFQRHRSPSLLRRLPSPIQRFAITAERGEEEEDPILSRDQTWSR